MIAVMGNSGINSMSGINSGAHSKNGPGIDSPHGIDRPLMCALLIQRHQLLHFLSLQQFGVKITPNS
jgi:hypothetical protein